ncbi:MAG: AMP-binding protein [Deltaproteobacteria bacterium]|nr:AMP-binding protein [Deltaproteobacteria bacterium]
MESFRSLFSDKLDVKHELTWLYLLHEGRATSYRYKDVISRTYDYCRFFQEKGIGEGDSILIVLKESIDLFASFFAGILLGARPAYSSYPSPKQTIDRFIDSTEALVRYNRIKLIVCYSEIYSLFSNKNVIADSSFLGYFTPEEVFLLDQLDIGDISVARCEAFVQYSSGTTGAKKGIQISIAALFNQLEAYGKFLLLDSDSKIVSWLPHYHDMGLVACTLMPFIKRIPLYLMSPFDWVRNPKILFEAITKYQCTHVWLPNFALGHLTKSIRSSDIHLYNLGSIKQIICCSEPLLKETCDHFAEKFSSIGINNSNIFNCYAMAENTFAMSSTRKGPPRFLAVNRNSFQKDNRIVPRLDSSLSFSSVGEPLDNIEISIRDDQNNILEENTAGEIFIKSNCMLDEYLNNEGETKRSIVDGWFHTGDIGFFHDSELYICGRKKDLIIVGGENIYPQDIELILNRWEGLIPGRNLVFGVCDERVGTEKIIVLAEAKDPSAKINTLDIRSEIFNSLNVSVADIIILPHMTLRKGTAGKISRHLNKQAYLEGAYSQVNQQGKESKNLRDVVQRIIPSDYSSRILEDTSLFKSGLLDSFAFIELIGALEENYELEIPEQYWTVENFETLRHIESLLARLPISSTETDRTDRCKHERNESYNRLRSVSSGISSTAPIWERIINIWPIRSSFCYSGLFKLAGIRIGKNVRFLGKVYVKLRGMPSNIVIGDNVTIGHNVDLRNRENGKIILGDRVILDSSVRLVAAREGRIEIGYGSEIGYNTIINSGGVTLIGEFALLAGNVNVNSSSHKTVRSAFVREQAHQHGKITIGDDVWIGSGASILLNTNIEEGAIVSSNSLVRGHIPAFAVCAGVPAKVICYR